MGKRAELIDGGTKWTTKMTLIQEMVITTRTKNVKKPSLGMNENEIGDTNKEEEK